MGTSPPLMPDIPLDLDLTNAFVMPEYEITVAPGNLEAFVTFLPFSRKKLPPLREVVRVLIADQKLVFVDEKAVSDALADGAGAIDAAKPRRIATGDAAVDGEDGSIEWLGEFFESRVVQLPDGSVDHYRRTQIDVYEGQQLLRIHPPTKGHAGVDVFGNKIKPKPGKEVPLRYDAYARRDASDPNVLVAARPGTVEYTRGVLKIDDVKVVENVDYSVGSIDFEGSVHVRKDIDAKFEIYAGGSVIVGGLVENALIESRNRIQIDGGMLGRDEGRLKCDGDIILGYARQTQIDTEMNLIVRKELLSCKGEVHGDLFIESGRLVGGTWKVGGNVILDELGSREEIQTHVLLGEAGERNAELTKITRERRRAHDRLRDFRRKFGPMLRGDIGNIDEEQKRKHADRLEAMVGEAAECRAQEFELRRVLGIQRRNSLVWARKGIHPGVRVHLNGGRAVFEAKEFIPGPVNVRYDPSTGQVILERAPEPPRR